MNGLKAFRRLTFLSGPVIPAGTLLSTNPVTTPINMEGFEAIVFFVKVGRVAATEVDISGTIQCPQSNTGGTLDEFVLTSDVFDPSGVGSRAPYNDKYASVAAKPKYVAVIPSTGGNSTFTFTGVAATSDTITVYAALAN